MTGAVGGEEAQMRPRTQRRRPAGRALLLAAAFVALVLSAALAAAACDMPGTGGLGQVIGSGTPVTKYYDLTGVTKVTVDSGFKVDVDYGVKAEASVTVDDNLVKEHLEVEVDGDTVHIGLADLWQYRDVTLRARVVLPRLTGLEASGSGAVRPDLQPARCWAASAPSHWTSRGRAASRAAPPWRSSAGRCPGAARSS